jgi:hypothetical protein
LYHIVDVGMLLYHIGSRYSGCDIVLYLRKFCSRSITEIMFYLINYSFWGVLAVTTEHWRGLLCSQHSRHQRRL